MEDNRNLFCVRLLFEMTIVGRAIWSDDTLNDSDKAKALKWLNEINHQILGAHNNLEYSFTDLESNIKDKASIIRILRNEVESAWNRAESGVNPKVT